MKKVIRSARGELVDFDLIAIKDQISSALPSVTIQAREQFIDNRTKRRSKKLTDEVINAAVAAAASKRVEVDVSPIPVIVKEVAMMIDEISVEEQVFKQKAKKSEG